MLLWSVKERLHAECGILDYGCGGGTLRHTLFGHFPLARYYGLDISDENVDNKGFRDAKSLAGTAYFGSIDELPTLLPIVDGMIMGSVFTHLSLRKMTQILDICMPRFSKPFSLCITAFLGRDFRFSGPFAYRNDPETFAYTIIKYDWFLEYCNKRNLQIVLHPFFFTTPFILPAPDLISRQSFITIFRP
jgi:SAM-dependent methyltransferase